MLLGVLAKQEIIIIFVVVLAIVFFIYQFGKQRGRLKELDRKSKEKDRGQAE